ncbi:hypothetical protein CTM88_19510 [Photobacterium aquimaris]|uniref:Phage tail assembly chaperone-like domain-containing protein n=1 Tax=Photobacterium aquimaris TaxID=512643 RepID=A0A2T3IF04_9GAMM|nr:tail fiber assembly protein [Photobacterium aquimaris]PSU24002.1 hypothetical protein CTM88_19510 [Photobacterium aquimaris]
MMEQNFNYGRPESEIIRDIEWESIRTQRDARLKATDFVIIQSQETGQIIPEKWKIYRQSLRDIPQTYDNPDDIVWPTKPTI